MASVTTPKINRIIRMYNFDLLGTQIKQYNMYMCLDTLQLWYDESPSKRTMYGYVGVDTMNDLQNNIVPNYGTTYYCWESNTLWLWMNKWICLYSDSIYPSAYQKLEGTIDEVYLDDQNPTIVDNNGLLRDGSVVIRDPQRIIKGRLYISSGNDNLILSSYLGGGIRILPNGAFGTEGELYIDDHSQAYIRASWNILNNEGYVDYGEHPEKDKNPYQNENHRYKIYHEGNFKAEDFSITSAMVYDKLVNPDSTLPDPLKLNVEKVGGHKASDFALKTHSHTASDITDFSTESQSNALTVMIDKLTNAISKGVKVTWDVSKKKFTLNADDYILAFTGGATGQGTVTDLTNTTIALTVDPSKHVHQNYIDRMDKIEKSIKDISSVDLSDYYNKTEVDDMFSATPIQDKALLVDNNGNLPGNALTASDLNHNTKLSLKGDITGNVTFGYEQLTLEMNTDASNVISDTPEPNKALKLDINSVLQAKAISAEKLDHNLTIKLTDDVTGSATWDTSTDTVTIKTKLDSSSKALTEADLGVTVASLDSNGIILDTQLPEGILNSLKLVSVWSGSTAPVSNPKEGQTWIVDSDCSYNGMNFKQGDWIYYFNNSWNRADISNGIHSVNSKTGNSITLTYSDVKAISDAYINYTIGGTVPTGKIPVTDKDGHLAGVTVDKVTKAFEFKSQGDIKVDTTSNSKTTDGSRDIDVKLLISTDGYKNIQKEIQRDIYVNGNQQPWRKGLSISGVGISATDDGASSLSIDFSEIQAMQLQNTVNINGTAFDGSIDITTSKWGTARNIYIADNDSTNIGAAVSVNGSANATLKLPATIKATLSGNASTATKLQTTRTINGTNFDGSANITTSKWGTARNVYIKDSDGTNTSAAVSVDGSANISLKLPSTIKASLSGNATSATKATNDSDGNAINTTYLKKSGGTMTGTLTSRALTPSANNSYAVGTSSARYSTGYFTTTNTTNLTVNGKKVFIQKTTPSGASSGDIWIVTK